MSTAVLPSQTQTDPLDTPESRFVLACALDVLDLAAVHPPASVKIVSNAK